MTATAMVRAAVVLPGPEPVLWEIPGPTGQAHEAIAHTLACGLCSSTDLRVMEGRLPFHGAYPAVLGHESISRIHKTAIQGGWPVGERVTRGCAVWPGIGRDGLHSGWGAMADEVLVRDPTAQAALGTPIDHASEYASQQRAIPADLPVLEAVLSISLSEVHSWINRVGNLAGKSVLILGSGIVGYGMVIMARLAGARSVVVLGRRENRLAQSRVLGADEAFFSDPRMQQSVRSALDGGADYLLDASGDPSAFAQWLAAVIPGGTAAAFGIPDSGQYSIPLGSLPQGVKFMAPRPKEAESLDVVWRALGEGRIPTGQLITHLWRWPQDLNEAFSAVRRGDVIKGIFLWPETSYRS